jgi:hypothetical protein
MRTVSARALVHIFFMFAVFVVLFATCVGCISAAARADTPIREERVTVAADTAASTVRIDVRCEDGSEWYGSGVVVDAKHILTAAHVVDCAGVYTVGGAIQVDVDAYSPDADLARLRVREGTALLAVPIHVAAPNEGDLICAETAVPERKRTCGSVVALTDEISDSMVMSVGIVRGNSGSAVYRVSDGALLGIVTECHLTKPEAGAPCVPHGGNATTLAGRKWWVQP